MLYYHFDSKLALYREIVRDMLSAVRDLATTTAALPAPADDRLAEFIAGIIRLADHRSWFPPLMLREFAEGAPRLDPDTFAIMKGVFAAFAQILTEGQQSGCFRPVHPVLAWLSLIGPILLNAARERAASRPGRLDVPMFAQIPHPDLTRHMQQAALRLLAREA
jgi:AcrR family transcriptional regulator